MDYLPEWKIYLWKRFLLNGENRGKIYQSKELIFFFFDLDIDDLRKTLDLQRQILMHSIRTGIFTTGEYTRPQDSLYGAEPKEVLKALIELADTKPCILEISKITLNKGYLIKYNQKRREYLVLHQKKTLSSVSIGSRRGTEPDSNYFNDKFCGLGENLYRSVESGKNLTLDELKLLITREQPIPLWDFLSFAISINKILLLKKMHEYINHFMLGELIPPPKVRYFGYQQQSEMLSQSIRQLSKKYGNQNFSITLDELAKEGGWQGKNEKNLRFYETVFALEMIGQIEIKALRKEEVVVSLTNKFDQPNNLPLSSSTLTTANRKKLCVLEKLKEEWDLTPETPVRTHVYFGYSHIRPAGEARLYGQKLSTWIQECSLNDRLELENVLAIFQQEGLISKFIFSEQEGDLKIQFSQDFERRYNEYKTGILSIRKPVEIEPQQQEKKDGDNDKDVIKTKAGLLIFNKDTGYAKLEKFEANLNPQSQEAKVLLKLMTDRNHQATYEDLLGENPSKTNKRNLVFVIRNLKEILGILPKKKAKNKDCIKNIKGYGYKLIT